MLIFSQSFFLRKVLSGTPSECQQFGSRLIWTDLNTHAAEFRRVSGVCLCVRVRVRVCVCVCVFYYLNLPWVCDKPRQVRLRICAGLFEPSLLSDVISPEVMCACSYFS